MYYTSFLKDTTDKHRCIGAGRSRSPEGPFKTLEKPIWCHEGTSIDPCGYVAANGTHYLLVKAQLPTVHVALQPLLSDGVTPHGQPVQLISATKAEGWNTEAPSLVKAGDTYYLFYSTQYWDSTQYTVSVATAPALMGPYTKRSSPLLKTGGEASIPGANPVAPGGADVLFDSSSSIKNLGDETYELKIVFHAAKSEHQLRTRLLWNGLVKVKGTHVEIA